MTIASNRKPRGVTLELWEGMSADARYQAHKDAAKKWWQTSTLYCIAIAPALLYLVVPPVQTLFNKHVIAPTHYVKLNGLADPRKFLNEATPKVGQTVRGYEITSEYGPRVHPITLAYSHHNGVDVGTPTGTPLYAPAVRGESVKVECWEQTDPAGNLIGGGLVANINSDSIPDYQFRALHLDTCKSGVYSNGEQFATTGNTGDSSGPHLDLQQLYAGTDQRTPPQSGYLEWLLSGNAGALEAVDINTLMDAIAEQESGGDSGIVNTDSAATGKYQIMPENIEGTGRGWDYEALGKDISVSDFLDDEGLQDAIAEHKLSEIAVTQSTDASGNPRSDRDIAERVAATWYSGDPDACTSTVPQLWDGDPNKAYPSIAEYCTHVGDRFDKLKQLKKGKN